MSLKRRNTSSAEPEEDDRPAKRPRPSWVDDFDTFEHPTAREQPRVDTSSGQQSAFPGLDDENDELIYGDPEDGLQYLRMVRSERKNVPYILVAERQTQMPLAEDEEEYDDEDYHADRAWVAAPRETLQVSEDDPDAQDLYYLALLDRFAQLQTHLRTAPPLSAIEILASSQPISFPSDAAKAREKWRHITKTCDPSPTQLACMDPESVMELMKLLTEGMGGIIKSRVYEKIKRMGSWVWATLARCRDRGELSSEEIAEVRELGKRAVQLLNFARRTRSAEAEAEAGTRSQAAIDIDESSRSEDEGRLPFDAVPGLDHSTQVETTADDEIKLEQAKVHMASMLETSEKEKTAQIAEGGSSAVGRSDLGPAVDKQIYMVLDATITIIGEVYGQRDLLEHRDIWE